jgi:hypothetical protein
MDNWVREGKERRGAAAAKVHKLVYLNGVRVRLVAALLEGAGVE